MMDSETTVTYLGEELEIFKSARNWKSYFSSRLTKFIGSRVLEVGAGLGETTAFLWGGDPDTEIWCCLEPDPKLFQSLVEKKNANLLPGCCEPVAGTTADLLGNSKDYRFDTIIYIDVIEHIEDDYEEIRRASAMLGAGGHLVILAPAHNLLFSPFDKAVGHYRRYDRKLCARLEGGDLKIVRSEYLDSLGCLLSLGNRFILKSGRPTSAQIEFWDSFIVPSSTICDRLFFFSLGKSILTVYKKL
jgi:SAM-dependent methyltransferase